jgi:hypothetical protein
MKHSDHSNRDRIPVGAEPVVKRLSEERATASPLELDRLKLQAIRQAERPRPSLFERQKGTFMKSRLAMVLVIVSGFMLSTTGAGLAVSGSSSSGSAADSQYVSPGGNEGTHGENHVKGVNGKGGEGNKANSEPSPEVEVEPAPAATEQEAVTSSGSTLPFTGFLAIPLLVIGLGLIVVGAVIRIKSKNEPAARL